MQDLIDTRRNFFLDPLNGYSSLFLISKVQPDPDDVIHGERTVGKSEYPTFGDHAINGESHGCGELAQKEPFRDTFARPFLPLLVHLFH
jgi:hypothetical protein